MILLCTVFAIRLIITAKNIRKSKKYEILVQKKAQFSLHTPRRHIEEVEV